MGRKRKTKEVTETESVEAPVEVAKQQPSKSDERVELEALQNTSLSDGTFVPKGGKIKVSKAYAELVSKEANPHFRVFRVL